MHCRLHRGTQKREGDEVSQDGAEDDPQEDPGVVGHDAEHQHVAQSHLENMKHRLDPMEQPAEEGNQSLSVELFLLILSGGKSLIDKNGTFFLLRLCLTVCQFNSVITDET